jgi:hypothetical protein
VRRIASNFGEEKNWLLHHNNAPPTLLFSQGNFSTKKQHDCRPPPILLFSVSLIEDKTETPPF